MATNISAAILMVPFPVESGVLQPSSERFALQTVPDHTSEYVVVGDQGKARDAGSAHQLEPDLSNARPAGFRVQGAQYLWLHQRQLGHPRVRFDGDEQRP